MALGVESSPERAKIFRKLRRGKELGDLRPDYQDLLIGLNLWVWLKKGADENQPPLNDRVISALKHPQGIDRFGGLSLGESSYLVDSITLQHEAVPQRMQFLKPDPTGFYDLPIWVDHLRNENNRQRFKIEELETSAGVEASWIEIRSEAES